MKGLCLIKDLRVDLKLPSVAGHFFRKRVDFAGAIRKSGLKREACQNSPETKARSDWMPRASA